MLAYHLADLPNPNWLWVVVVAIFGAIEGWALAMRHDKLLPATYWIRKLPLFVRGAAITWLAIHFLVQ